MAVKWNLVSSKIYHRIQRRKKYEFLNGFHCIFPQESEYQKLFTKEWWLIFSNFKNFESLTLDIIHIILQSGIHTMVCFYVRKKYIRHSNGIPLWLFLVSAVMIKHSLSINSQKYTFISVCCCTSIVKYSWWIQFHL